MEGQARGWGAWGFGLVWVSGRGPQVTSGLLIALAGLRLIGLQVLLVSLLAAKAVQSEVLWLSSSSAACTE